MLDNKERLEALRKRIGRVIVKMAKVTDSLRGKTRRETDDKDS